TEDQHGILLVGFVCAVREAAPAFVLRPRIEADAGEPGSRRGRAAARVGTAGIKRLWGFATGKAAQVDVVRGEPSTARIGRRGEREGGRPITSRKQGGEYAKSPVRVK